MKFSTSLLPVITLFVLLNIDNGEGCMSTPERVGSEAVPSNIRDLVTSLIDSRMIKVNDELNSLKARVYNLEQALESGVVAQTTTTTTISTPASGASPTDTTTTMAAGPTTTTTTTPTTTTTTPATTTTPTTTTSTTSIATTGTTLATTTTSPPAGLAEELNDLKCELAQIFVNEDSGCAGAAGSGVKAVVVRKVYGQTFHETESYCDMDTDGGDWILIQRRRDSTEDFARSWADYSTGFGDPNGDFWIGNEVLNLLTSRKSYELRIDINDQGTLKHAKYSEFKVASYCDNFRLTVSGYTGDTGDLLAGANNQEFMTQDTPGGAAPTGCTEAVSVGWWRGTYCDDTLIDTLTSGNLNGSPLLPFFDMLTFTFTSDSIEMKIRATG